MCVCVCVCVCVGSRPEEPLGREFQKDGIILLQHYVMLAWHAS